MKIGLLQIALHVPASGSLKHKRRHLQSLKQEIRNKFNVSVAEVDHHDQWQRIDLAVVMVSTEAAYIDRVFSEIVKAIARRTELEILDESREML